MTTFRCNVLRIAFAVLLTGSAGADEAPAIDLPSGVSVTLLDVITHIPGQGLTYRFRFLAPHIAQGPDYATVAPDMQFLCDSHALPRLANIGPVPNQIVITMLDRLVDFGEISPDAIQFFEAYRPDSDACVREDF